MHGAAIFAKGARGRLLRRRRWKIDIKINVLCFIRRIPRHVEAERIGKAVLEKRLAACVNILPGMISHYWWQGAIERGEEV
jgi:hypothetical protein